jgi:uncharacterized membrane protein YcaP (DUF421 family)
MPEVLVVIVRSATTFAVLVVLTRLLGKTQVSQLTFFEYISGTALGSIASTMSINLSLPPFKILIGLFTWTALTLLTQLAALRCRWFFKLVDGAPTVVIQNGQVLEGNLRSLRMPIEELTSLLRAKGVFDIQAVECAVMELHGSLSVRLRSQERPVTPRDLHLPTAYEGLAIELVVDGQVIDENLRHLHVNRAWLEDRLHRQGVSSPAEVAFAVIDTQGQIYIDRYQDRLPPPTAPATPPAPTDPRS